MMKRKFFFTAEVAEAAEKNLPAPIFQRFLSDLCVLCGKFLFLVYLMNDSMIPKGGGAFESLPRYKS
jgi:hypothetical protein